jgi:hypothetical protein
MDKGDNNVSPDGCPHDAEAHSRTGELLLLVSTFPTLDAPRSHKPTARS